MHKLIEPFLAVGKFLTGLFFASLLTFNRDENCPPRHGDMIGALFFCLAADFNVTCRK